jgi:hypothetical protein
LREEHTKMKDKIYWTITIMMLIIWAAGFLLIAAYYENTVTNMLQKWANTTGAQMLYILVTMPTMLYIEDKFEELLKGRK